MTVAEIAAALLGSDSISLVVARGNLLAHQNAHFVLHLALPFHAPSFNSILRVNSAVNHLVGQFLKNARNGWLYLVPCVPLYTR